MNIPDNWNLPPGCTDEEIEGTQEEETENPYAPDSGEPREE
jgi:hypothetical protein